MAPDAMTWPRVLSYPPRHHYVDRLHGRTARLVHRDEQMPTMPRLLDPEWVSDHASEWDIAHLHLARFVPGEEGASPAQIAEVVRAHRRQGVSVVVTVHDLAQPTWPEQDRQLRDVLTAINPEVQAVLTLTRGCAADLEEMLDRPVRVIPYGPLLDATTRHRLRARRRLLEDEDRPLLLHAGRLEPRLAWEDTIAAVIASRTGARLRVLVEPDHVATVEQCAQGHPRVQVVPYREIDSSMLAQVMANASALVLPYRWATHSATLELASDVGVPVIATDVGHLAEQQPIIGLTCPEGTGLDVAELTEVIDAGIPPGPMVREVDRERDLHALTSHHARLYTQLSMARPAVSPPVEPAPTPGATVSATAGQRDDTLDRTPDLSVH